MENTHLTIQLDIELTSDQHSLLVERFGPLYSKNIEIGAKHRLYEMLVTTTRPSVTDATMFIDGSLRPALENNGD